MVARTVFKKGGKGGNNLRTYKEVQAKAQLTSRFHFTS